MITAGSVILFVTVCMVGFNTFAEAAVRSEMGRVETVPTVYNVPAQETGEEVPKGYKKANYTVEKDPLEYYKNQKPAEKDLTQEEAAELGARLVWKIFGAELDGAIIYMGYDSGTSTLPRATWSGDIRFGTERKPEDNCYSFIIDAVTGENFSVCHSRTLNVKVELGLDADLEKNPQEYLELAKQFAEQKELVGGKVAAVRYNCQGYSANDPDIAIDVVGENGEKANITISRYDKAVKGICFNASMENVEALENNIQQQGKNGRPEKIEGTESVVLPAKCFLEGTESVVLPAKYFQN